MKIREGGASYFPGWLDQKGQEKLRDIVRGLLTDAPLYRPVMPRTGKPLSVRMTNFGKLGWISDRQGYRYDTRHPVTGDAWPAIPGDILAIWRQLTPDNTPDPDACLVNYYDSDAKMGLHQDRDEADLTQPVLSISLGDDAMFRLGQTTRGGKTLGFRLKSGDVFLLQGEDRLAYHGISRIYPGTSTLLERGGRINLTLRKVV